MTGRVWKLKTRRLDLHRALIMGIVNVTPDSFSDGGLAADPEAAIAHGRALVARGADILDVGGESTRPGAEPVSIAEEMRRVVPAVEALCADGHVVSIDTMKPEVAAAALEAGAEIVNDVGGMGDPRMRRIAAEAGAGVVVMHMKGEPRTMQVDPRYEDVLSEVCGFLSDRARMCIADGIVPEAICVDPGIGFGKTLDHNLSLIDGLETLGSLGHPVLIGASRKQFLGTLLDLPDPRDRDLATAVITAIAVERGASVVRVHEPRGSREAAGLARAMVMHRTTRRPSQ